jgi:hypothetical protein
MVTWTSAAWADAPTTIAVIPLQAERRLALYGAPVASELSASLRHAGFEVVLLSDGTEVPTRAWLVVDGRILNTGKAITIELRVRDPEHAVDVARLAAHAVTVNEIDGATKALAADLTRVIEAAQASRDHALTTPTPTLTPTTTLPPTTTLTPTTTATPTPPPPIDPRPRAVIIVHGKPLHRPSGEELAIVPLTTPAMNRLASRLGYRTDSIGARGLTITADLSWVAAGYEGEVPIGRGRVHVTVTRETAIVFDRVVRTDTVVGSRGDRVDTLVRLIAEQVADIVAPRIRERLAARP